MKLNTLSISRLGVLMLLCFGLTSAALAQTAVTGTVTDAETGDPLIGASILVLGTSTGTVTDFDGNYTLNVPANAEALIFSYTGFSAQTIELSGQSRIDISLSPGATLQDVVVVGYGSVRKEDATGAVVALGEDDFQKGIISSPEQLLQGRAAGVQITQTSGEPGGGINVRIRGTASVRGGNGPLYVVDGIPLDNSNALGGSEASGLGASSGRNPLNFINPSDIESINVLKDASAAAIYGSRGANGVVIIKTKSGLGGTSPLQFSASTAVSSVARRFDLLSTEEFIQEAAEVGAMDVDRGGDVDWQDEIFRNAFSQDYSVAYGGGNENSNYRFSLGYLNQEGVVVKSGLERLVGRINANTKALNDRLELGVSLTASRINDEFAPIVNDAGFEGDLLGAALQANPTQPIFNEDGTFFQAQDFRNPVAISTYIDDVAQTTRLLANITAGFNITDNLQYKFTYGFDNSAGERRTDRDVRLRVGDIFEPTGNFPGFGEVISGNITNELIEHTLNFNTDIGNNRLDLLAGFSYQTFDISQAIFNVTNLINPDIRPTAALENVNLNDNPRSYSASSSASFEELQSFFGRANFNIQERFLLTATVRIDGSTRFGENNKYGTFPSFSAAWRLSEEDWFPDLFESFKLRAGWGITGNQEFPSNNLSTGAIDVNDEGGQQLRNLPNPDLKWEETTQFNIGVDFGFNNGKVTGSLDYFNKRTEDLLFPTFNANPAPPGAVSGFVNLPNPVFNRGVELTLDLNLINTAKASWSTTLTGAYVFNEFDPDFDQLLQTGAIDGQGLTGAFVQAIAGGRPLNSYFIREFGGYDDAGNAIYPNGADVLTFIGEDPLPDVNIGLLNQFTFGDFDFNFFLQGVFGFSVYNNTANAIFLRPNLRNARNITVDAANSEEGPANFGEASSRFLERGDFVRLQNASLGYTFDTGNWGAISSLRVFVTGQNLLLFTDYSGPDPEVDTDKSINGVPSVGIDYTAYPRARTILFGFNASF
ncbi:MAG: SusC/RagA family TonB-linked outer membrane protein [Bacteroidota bacterium]